MRYCAFLYRVESRIGQDACVCFDFPASQAALKNSPQDRHVAIARCILRLNSRMVSAIGASLKTTRFEQDNVKQLEMGLKPQPIDYHLIAALEAGLPDCAGVALGVDRHHVGIRL